MALPPLRADGTLPPGRHYVATLDEVFAIFPATTGRRQLLDAALRRLVEVVTRFALGTALVIDGSYVTSKAEPADIDLALFSTGSGETAILQQLQAEGVDLMLLDVFVSITASNFDGWVQFFSADRTGHDRGVVMLTI
jgi:hypothetical protein